MMAYALMKISRSDTFINGAHMINTLIENFICKRTILLIDIAFVVV